MEAKVNEETRKAGINKQCNMQANDNVMANLSEIACETLIFDLLHYF